MSPRFLVVVSSDGARRAIECSSVSTQLGNRDGNDVLLAHPDVSERHARIVCKDGKFILVDLKSKSGTFVRERRLNSPLVIRESEPFRIGPFELWIEELREPDLELGELQPEEAQLLDIVAADPSDLDARRVYADHLMDRGDPLGEFISLQCELAAASMPAASRVERRLRDLLKRAPEIAALVSSGLAFDRGFLTDAMLTTPVRRSRAGRGLHRLSPAIYELTSAQTHSGGATLHRAHRHLPSGGVSDVTILRWGDEWSTGPTRGDEPDDRVAINQARLRNHLGGAVAPALDVVRHDHSRQVGLAMMWPFGLSLRELIGARDQPRLSVAAACAVAVELARALAAINEAGVHMRAINPNHVIVGPSGEITLADISWAERPGDLVPHPEVDPLDFVPLRRQVPQEVVDFAAPALTRRTAASPATDVFVIARVLGALIAGERPRNFQRASAALNDVIGRGLERDPEERFDNANDMADAISDVARGLGWRLGAAAVAEAIEEARR